ncbi:hypothetical protein IT400_00740 [Candidatus Nomurabacteria bacterium]|nr:hypothetical protein [Candidatus Nomurabacteria bacterium]
MNYFQSIILNIQKKTLRAFLADETILQQDEFKEYGAMFPEIQDCYKEVGYWHGTGRYRYGKGTLSRYDDVGSKQISDMLESIISEGGLKPHKEPWLYKIDKIGIKSNKTTSLTPFRMYAKLYAGLYLNENKKLLYEYGSVKFWFGIFIMVQILNLKFLYFVLTRGLFWLSTKSTYKDTKTFMGTIRSDIEQKNISPFKGHLLRSDIVGNYPILFGIKKTIKIVHFNSILERLEKRTDNPILFNDITHIEVPINNVKETEELLKQKNIDLKIIPFEYGEVYCNNYLLENLTK